MRDIPVSVVMPVFNAGVYLREAVESILAQTFEDFEFIIVDDGSTDDSPRILREYQELDGRIRVVAQENRGVIAALNRGCSLARGRYIARMDADDVALPHRLERQVAALENRPEIGLLGAAVQLVDASGAVIGRVVHPLSDREIRAALRQYNCFTHPATVFRRDVWTAVNGYRRAFLHAEEYDLWLRMAERCEMANLAEVVLRYRIHDSQVSATNLRAQIVSTLGAQVAAEERERTGFDRFAGPEAVSLDRLPQIRPEEVEEKLVEARLHWADVLERAGFDDAAMELLDPVLSTGPAGGGKANLSRASIIRARVCYRSGDALEAARLLLSVVRMRPGYLPYLARRSLRMLGEGLSRVVGERRMGERAPEPASRRSSKAPAGMRIVLLSDLETFGGAAIAATRLTSALAHAGHEVVRVVYSAAGGRAPWPVVDISPGLALRIGYRLFFRPEGRRAMEVTMVRKRLRRVLREVRPDVVSVHNLHSANLRPELLRECAAAAPTVWTLHDMWSFTGRCACSYDCRMFVSGCNSACPTPDEYPALAPDRIEDAWIQRRNLLAELPELVAVTPSRWLKGEARAGLWRDHKVEVIPNGLPLDTYRPYEPAEARKRLGIPDDRPVLLVSSADLSVRHKGGKLLEKALARISRVPVTLVTMGRGELSVCRDGVRVVPLGYLEGERAKALAFSAADLLVHPALVDNLPNVVMEALACGTPVVGFPIGGVPEMVRPGQTGWLAEEVSPRGLARAVDAALEDLRDGCFLRPQCRQLVEAEYSSRLQAERYLALFSSLAGSAAPETLSTAPAASHA